MLLAILGVATQPMTTPAAPDRSPDAEPDPVATTASSTSATTTPVAPPYDPTENNDDVVPLVRRGLVVEGDAGFGFIHSAATGASSYSQLALGAFGFGVGRFVTPRLALTGRYSGVLFKSDGGDISLAGFLGPSLQIWAADRIWFRGGLGAYLDGGVLDDPFHLLGVGVDVGGGYLFTASEQSAFSVGVEVTSGFGHGNAEGVSVMLAYEYL